MIGFICVMHKSKFRPNGFELINNFIKSLYEFCKKDFTLYLFDNGSDEKYDVPNYPNIKYEYIEDQTVGGLLRPYNDGVTKAIKDKCDIIVFVNDDIILNETINIFFDIIGSHKHNKVSLYGPLSNGLLRNTSFQEAQKPGKGVMEITHEKKSWGILNGFLMAFTRRFYHKFKLPNGNLVDPINKWGGGEGTLKRRIKPRGGKLFIIKDCWVFHHKIRGWKNFKDAFLKRKKVREK